MSRGGVAVLDVRSGSPSEAAGLLRGTVISAVDGKSVRTPKQFREAVEKFAGKPAPLTIAGRGEIEGTRQVTVAPE
jgi:S1-C subfamily serine protease